MNPFWKNNSGSGHVKIPMISLVGSWSDHVPAVLCQGRPVEYRHHCVPVPHWQGPIPGTDPSAAQTLLRKTCRAQAKVSDTEYLFVTSQWSIGMVHDAHSTETEHGQLNWCKKFEIFFTRKIWVFGWFFLTVDYACTFLFSFLNSIPKDTSPELRDLLLKMLKRNAKDRIEFGILSLRENLVSWQLQKSLLYRNTALFYSCISEDFFKHPFLKPPGQSAAASCKYSNHSSLKKKGTYVYLSLLKVQWWV